MRRPVIAGNWKMYKTIAEAVDFIEKIKPVVEKADHCEVVVAPPFTALAGSGRGGERNRRSVWLPKTCIGTRKARIPVTFPHPCWWTPAART